MPTTRKRHSITETPPVESALNALRAACPGERIDLGELVVLGAWRRIEQITAGRELQDSLIEDLADRVLRGDLGIDPDAAEEVRARGWARG